MNPKDLVKAEILDLVNDRERGGLDGLHAFRLQVSGYCTST